MIKVIPSTWNRPPVFQSILLLMSFLHEIHDPFHEILHAGWLHCNLREPTVAILNTIALDSYH